MKLIEQNPFRMLGIPVNAGARDLAANKGKFQLLSIGREVSFPLDLAEFLPPVERTSKSVETAEREINQPQDKIRHALFWFAKPSAQLGAIAYDNMLCGNMDTAMKNFRRSSDWESLLCLSTLSLQQGDVEGAFAAMGAIIDKYCSQMVSSVAGQTYTTDESSIRHLYVSSLAEEMDAAELYSQLKDVAISKVILDELRSLAVDAPIVAIERDIAEARAINTQDAKAQLRAGDRLKNTTSKSLLVLKNLVGSSDIRYGRIADKLANQILQCSISYFNNIDGENREIIENALKLGEYALKIAIGKMAQDHILHNVGILRKKKAQLPPIQVQEQDTAIKAKIVEIMLKGQTIDNAILLMKGCAPHIVAIKEKQTEDPNIRNYYLSISTQVVNAALTSVIEEHNRVQEKMGTLTNDASELTILTYMSTVNEMLKKAWKAMLMMDQFDKEEGFLISRYAENRKALRDMCNQMPGLNTATIHIGYNDIDLRTDDEFYAACRTSANYKAYLNRYPNAKHKTSAQSRYNQLLAEEEKKRKEKEEKERQTRQAREVEDRVFNACNSVSDYEAYLRQYPNGYNKRAAEQKIKELKDKAKSTGCTVAIVLWIIGGGVAGAIIGESVVGFIIGCLLALGFVAKAL